MNILIPDSWLREYLKTKATPTQIKEYLSLCGPSVERINRVGKETIYDVEITSNRPDAMSLVGIAREGAAILPRFKVPATLTHDPYRTDTKALVEKYQKDGPKNLKIVTDPKLNPRFAAIVIDSVKVGPSPAWLRQKLEATGIRSLNNVIDITNYLMRAFGQPAHAFDFTQIKAQDGIPTMKLRSSRQGEKITTLEGKTHSLPGDDIVIEDGSGRLIDLCGIMGAENSSIKPQTQTVVLFLQTYDPSHIRRTSMALAQRTEAANLFEKGLDSELVLPALLTGIELVTEIAGGKVASRLYDLYPQPYQPTTVTVNREKIKAYLGVELGDGEIRAILTALGFTVNATSAHIVVTVPSWRSGDVTLDVDIIEEIARLYGFHKIASRLPASEPPVVLPDPDLTWEEEIKTRLRDWGYTETYTYSLISAQLMDIFSLDKNQTYKIANPLSSEWVYLRPSLVPSLLSAAKQNLAFRPDLRLFEISMIYSYRPGNLPAEIPTLIVAWSGREFPLAKGLAQAIFALLGVNFPVDIQPPTSTYYHHSRSLALGTWGQVGEVAPELLTKLAIKKPLTLLELNLAELIAKAKPGHTYQPLPKYPPSFEDLAFILPPQTYVGPIITALKGAHPLVANVELLDTHAQTRTLHITYLSNQRNLTAEDVRPVREKLVTIAQDKFGAKLKTA